MLRNLFHLALLVLSLSFAGCSSGNFMVKKGGTSFFITSDRTELREILCDSGDMDSIVRDSNLPETLQQGLKEKVCTARKDKNQLKSLIASMSKVQLDSFQDAFRKNGYEINLVADG